MAFQKNEDKGYDDTYQIVDNFFETLYHHGEDDELNDSLCNLKYREGQHSYALDIMDAIKNREVLLMQAGVGIGKSFGYLLPVFNTFNKVKTFNRVIISTSSIALQEQLLNDIKIISNMLDIEIKVDIAKGVINYACLKRIYYHINSYLTLPENKKILDNLIFQIEMIESSDRSDLMEVSEDVWKSIQLQSSGYCSKCTYSRMFLFYKKQKELSSNNIIITNYANMVKNIIDNTDMVKDLDMVIFDEAHKLEENIRNVQLNELRLNNICYQINKVASILGQNYSNGVVSSFDEEEDFFGNILQNDVANLFSSIRTSASRNFAYMKKKNNNEEDYSITDYNRLSFKISSDVLKNLDKVLAGLDILLREVEFYEHRTGIQIRIKELYYLKVVKDVLLDMKKGRQYKYLLD